MTVSKITALDRHLYAWLNESDDRRFAAAFNAYFSIAFPAVIRFLARISRWDSVRLEELAQDALLKFFEKVGRERRAAADTVAVELTLIRPLPHLDSAHPQQVNRWVADAVAFRTAAMGFAPPGSAPESAWRLEIRALTEQMRLIRGEGWQLLASTLRSLGVRGGDAGHNLAADRVNAAPTGKGDFDHWMEEDETADIEQRDAWIEREVNELATRFTHALTSHVHDLGVPSFVDHTCKVVKNVPRLRVPTNSYLFNIAMTIYLDECKKHGRLKRGGDGLYSERGIAEASLQDQIEPDSEIHFDEPFRVPEDGIAPDPAQRYEFEEYFTKFYEYLYRPVSDAAKAYEEAIGQGRANLERQRLKSRADKFARTTSILSLLGAGHTQEEAAELLGLTRNQVKYMVELIQEAYVRFASTGAPLTAPKKETFDVQQ